MSLFTIYNYIEKAREFQRNIYFCFIDYAKTFDCVDHSKLENSWRDRNTKSPYLPPEGSLACCNPWRHKELDMHVLFCKGWLKLHDMWLWLLKEISLEVSNVKWESSLVAQMVKHLPTMQETWVQSLGRKDLLEKERQPTPVFLPGEIFSLIRINKIPVPHFCSYSL